MTAIRSGPRSLGFEEEAAAQEPEGESAGETWAEQWFLPDDVRGLRVLDQPLSEYLIDRGLSWVVNLRALLEALDFGPLTRGYSPGATRRCIRAG